MGDSDSDAPSPMLVDLDRYIPADIRAWIEQRFYAKINQQAVLDEAVKDPTLWIDTGNHVALFSDHGVVHMRDVMRQTLTVLDTISGVLVPLRPAQRLETVMKGYGALVAALHDIGMADFSAFGRKMHPEFAAQAVFSAEFDRWIEQVWDADCGQLRRELTALEAQGAFAVPPQVVLREMLALSMCHSKRKVPIHVMNAPMHLQALLQTTIATDLRALFANADHLLAGDPLRWYRGMEFERCAFAWLTSERPQVRQLRDDLLDVLRALRCADALRQRGTVLRTSASYEMFVNQQTANLVVALRDRDDHALLLELSEGGIGAGEANIAGSELGRDGHLRISFQRGSFANTAAFEQAVKDATYVVDDIQSDVISSFIRASDGDDNGGGRGGDGDGANGNQRGMHIHLESTDDNPAFVEAVCQQLSQRKLYAERVEIVPSLRQASDLERARYLACNALDWSPEQQQFFLQHIAQAGQKVEGIDPTQAFKHIKLAELQPDDVLVEARAPSGFVYFPLNDGLWVRPLGGYAPIAVRPWRPLGNTGVIRGADRNADIVARERVQVLILPKDIYLRHWYRPFTVEELRARMTG